MQNPDRLTRTSPNWLTLSLRRAERSQDATSRTGPKPNDSFRTRTAGRQHTPIPPPRILRVRQPGLFLVIAHRRVMPEQRTLERARRDKAQGKAPSTQAGEFVREEMHHIRQGK